MKTINNIKYSQRFADLASVIVIDEEVVKNKFGKESDLTKEDIQNLKYKYERLLIQNGYEIDIYCKSEYVKPFKQEKERLRDAGFSEESLENIRIYVKSI